MTALPSISADEGAANRDTGDVAGDGVDFGRFNAIGTQDIAAHKDWAKVAVGDDPAAVVARAPLDRAANGDGGQFSNGRRNLGRMSAGSTENGASDGNGPGIVMSINLGAPVA